MHLVTVSIGRPQLVQYRGETYSTAINRQPTDRPIAAGIEGLADDRVSNRNVHGGPDKAICCYPHEHYAFLAERLGRSVDIPACGENFTTAGLLETNVRVGDTFRVGSSVVQVTQPRQPCAKLARKHDEPRLIGWMNDTGFCGFYLRVIEPGTITRGDAINCVERAEGSLTIAELIALRVAPKSNPALWRRVAALPALSASWREFFERLVRGETDDD